jgi:sugar lactone lactonase YvrE
VNHTALAFVCLFSSTVVACSGTEPQPVDEEEGEISSEIAPPGAQEPDGADVKKPKLDPRPGLVLPGSRFFPEGIAAGSDGSFYVGSMGTGAIVRFAPGATQSQTLVPARDAFGVYGLAVDEDRDLLWACTYDDLLYPAQPAYLKAYSLDNGAEQASFVMPGDSGFCNDLILDDEGNVYATDALANTIVRLPSGGSALETWSADPAFADEPGNFTVNGIVFDPDSSKLYVVKYSTGQLFSIRVNADGSAGTVHEIQVNSPLQYPDGIEMLHDGVFLVVENNIGRVSVVALWGGSAHRFTIAQGLNEPTTAAIHNRSAWVVEGQGSLLYGEDEPSLPFRVRRVPTF